LGKVSGRVKIINDISELGKIEIGDILVSIQTTPELLPAMKKASAFVTEVGGITSHAAIVARELRKPCIVGTKIATHILRDNDFVQVDANHGLVRILERVA